MHTIAFVTQKGGSGKSTIASSLAVSASDAGEKVFIVDMDPQASLIKWAKARGEPGIPVEAMTSAKLAQALALMEKKGITLAVIDTPGTDSSETKAAMKHADLCIIPARPNVFDLWASDLTRKTLREMKREFVFLLNQCPPAQQTARVEQGAKALEAMGGLITPLVAACVDYQEAARHGLGVTEYNANGYAAEEMRRLWASLKKRLNKGKAAGAKKAA